MVQLHEALSTPGFTARPRLTQNSAQLLAVFAAPEVECTAPDGED